MFFQDFFGVWVGYSSVIGLVLGVMVYLVDDVVVYIYRVCFFW